MLDVNATGIGAGQISDQLLKRRRALKRVLRRNVEETLRWGLRFDDTIFLASFWARLV